MVNSIEIKIKDISFMIRPALLVLLTMFFISFTSTGKTTKEPKKLALIVAVGEYAKVGEYSHITSQTEAWDKISSANDVPLILSALKHQGFKEEHILILRDKDATDEGIRNAFQQHLIDGAGTGDIIFFHFSGHGQQVMSDNEDELDGYDEALVPYNAAKKFVKGVYEGEKHILDDELGRWIEITKKKVGPEGSILVTLDACHSGTATRGVTVSRGTIEKMAPVGYKPSVNNGTRGPQAFSNFVEYKNSKTGAPVVIISGSSADQLNYETKNSDGEPVGSLSYAFSRAIARSSSETTFAGLFDQIRIDISRFAPRQTPQLEGDMNRKIFSGRGVTPVTHYKVIDVLNKSRIRINLGSLMGVMEGSTVVLYHPDEDTLNAEPKATGRIVYSEAFESEVVLDSPLEMENAMRSWVYLKEKNFGKMQVSVRLDVENDLQMLYTLKAEIAKYPFIAITDQEADLLLEMNSKTQTRGQKELHLITNDDQLIFSSPLSNTDKAVAESITKKIISFAQANYLRNLTLTDNRNRITVEVIPWEVVKVIKGSRTVYDIKGPLSKPEISEAAIPELKIGDFFKIRIINHGNSTSYVTILDIQPDNQINVLVPGPKRTAEEIKVAPKDTLLLQDIFIAGEPAGMEALKIIATRAPLNIRPLVASRGTDTRTAITNPLEELLLLSYQETGTRSGDMLSLGTSAGMISTYLFNIKAP